MRLHVRSQSRPKYCQQLNKTFAVCSRPLQPTRPGRKTAAAAAAACEAPAASCRCQMRHGVLCCWACMLLACALCTAGSRTTGDGGRSSSSDGGGSTSSSNATAETGRVPPPFVPNSARAVPTVALIGTAKAGTTDLYSLITKISRQAPGAKRMKEAKLLVEQGGPPLAPGTSSFHTYLQRIGHPCAAAAKPHDASNRTSTSSMGRTAAAAAASGRYAACVDSLATQQPPGQQPLSVDATPMYLAVPRVADALRALSPDTKVLVLLRHPIERAESLYNHRAHTEAQAVLPPRVGNASLNAWGRAFLDWLAASPPTTRTQLQRLAAASSLDEAAALYRALMDGPPSHTGATTTQQQQQQGAANLLGLPPGPLTFAAYNRNGSIERNLFGGALYGPALAAWRAAFRFRPGQLMVIDAHAFFADRLGVLDAVQRFLQGRGLTDAERRIAARLAIANARRARGIRLPGAALEGAVRHELAAFYRPFNAALLTRVLPTLQAEGAHVVGFEGAPWSDEVSSILQQ